MTPIARRYIFWFSHLYALMLRFLSSTSPGLVFPSNLSTSLPSHSGIYSNIVHTQLMEILGAGDGYCQPPPPGCPREIYRTMVECWWVQRSCIVRASRGGLSSGVIERSWSLCCMYVHACMRMYVCIIYVCVYFMYVCMYYMCVCIVCMYVLYVCIYVCIICMCMYVCIICIVCMYIV